MTPNEKDFAADQSTDYPSPISIYQFHVSFPAAEPWAFPRRASARLGNAELLCTLRVDLGASAPREPTVGAETVRVIRFPLDNDINIDTIWPWQKSMISWHK